MQGRRSRTTPPNGTVKRLSGRGTSPEALAGLPPPVPSLGFLNMPPWLRHIEAFLVTIAWVAAFPLLLQHGSAFAPIVSLIVIGIALVSVHSCLLRPYCNDFDEEEEPNDEDVEDLEHLEDHHSEQGRPSVKVGTVAAKLEARKFVLYCFVFLSAAGSIISFDHGGSDAYLAWKEKSTDDCSVADLGSLQGQSKSKFHCQDGIVDFDSQVTMMEHAGGLMRPSLKTYTLAPVYKDEDHKKHEGPVAFALAEDKHLIPSPCDGGLCGFIISSSHGEGCRGSCLTKTQQASVETLKRVLEKELHHKDGDFKHLPILNITTPTNPNGMMRVLFLGIGMYAFALLGLLVVQLMLCLEEPPRKQRTSGSMNQVAAYNLLPGAEESTSRS